MTFVAPNIVAGRLPSLQHCCLCCSPAGRQRWPTCRQSPAVLHCGGCGGSAIEDVDAAAEGTASLAAGMPCRALRQGRLAAGSCRAGCRKFAKHLRQKVQASENAG